MQEITLAKPDDWHIHLRHGEALKTTVPAVASHFARALVMPNLVPPISTAALALEYRAQILAAKPADTDFNPLMALYLTAETDRDTVKAVAEHTELLSFKLYPAGATTHSSAGIKDLTTAYPIFAEMERLQVPLCIHGEVVDAQIDIFDREAVFIDRHLTPLIQSFPQLKIVFEHITSKYATDFIKETKDHIVATITAHHLWLTRNDLLVGGIKPHYYCLPIVKTDVDRQALITAAISGSNKFFLGSDSAPHANSSKLSACGCAGIFTANYTLEYYAEIFAQHNSLNKLANFASLYGAEFYGLQANTAKITLQKQAQTIPAQIDYLDEQITPFCAGTQLNWQIQT